MTLDGGFRIDDVQLVLVRRDGDLVAADHGNLGEQRTVGLPALGTAAHVVVRHLRADLDRYLVGVAMTGQGAARKIGLGRLDAVIDCRVNLDCFAHHRLPC
jgi:hypothetical protein